MPACANVANTLRPINVIGKGRLESNGFTPRYLYYTHDLLKLRLRPVALSLKKA